MMTIIGVVVFIVLVLAAIGFIKGPKKEDLDVAVRVVDGDSLESVRTRFRLFGIDAPELTQEGGWEAKNALVALVADKHLTFILQGRDIYGRSLITLFADGVDVGQAMVRNGYALNNTYANVYGREEKKAKRSKAGLWKNGTIACPKAYRAANM